MSSSSENTSSYEREVSMNTNEKKGYHRHSPQQIQRLDGYFKECPHPDESQRRKLSEELNLNPKQVKFWFQNKRTQAKTQSEREENAALRAENLRMRSENEAMQEALRYSLLCVPCGGPNFATEEDRQRHVDKLRFDNAILKQQFKRLINFINQQGGEAIPNVDPSNHASSSNNPHVVYGAPSMNTPPLHPRSPLSLHQVLVLSEMEKMVLSETTVNAVKELVSLIQIDEPMWIKSSIDGRLVIDQDYYEKMVKQIDHVKIPNPRFESSKDVMVVPFDARTLVHLFFDTDHWARLFPTIVNEAKTVHVLDYPDGKRQSFSMVMYQQQHILSPMIPAREFLILRSCQQMDENIWLIADVSCHLQNLEVDFSDLNYFKRPSGCLIQALPSGQGSKVTWIEHVVLNDKSVKTHRLYRDLLFGGNGYGAKRWVVTLERLCERLSLTSNSTIPATDIAGVVKTAEGRRSVMILGERMLRNFAWILKMSEKFDFSQLSVTNNSGVRVSVRANKEIGQPNGLIVSAGSSLSLPFPPIEVYTFLKNLDIRHHWDVLCHGSPLTEITRFVTGTDHKSCVNLLQPTAKENNGLVIIQDSFIDALGGMLVYAPVDLHTAYSAASGTINPATIPILPSGFIISGDGRPCASSSSTLLSVAFQILVSNPSKPQEVPNLEDSTSTVNTLISSTIQRIKQMLNCEVGH